MVELDDGSWIFEPGILEHIISFANDNIRVGEMVRDYRANLLMYSLGGYKEALIKKIGGDSYRELWNQRRMDVENVSEWDEMRINAYLKTHMMFDMNTPLETRKNYCRMVMIKEFLESDMENE